MCPGGRLGEIRAHCMEAVVVVVSALSQEIKANFTTTPAWVHRHPPLLPQQAIRVACSLVAALFWCSHCTKRTRSAVQCQCGQCHCKEAKAFTRARAVVEREQALARYRARRAEDAAAAAAVVAPPQHAELRAARAALGRLFVAAPPPLRRRARGRSTEHGARATTRSTCLVTLL